MAIHEQRLLKLRAHVGDARSELQALPAEDRETFEHELARLEEVVADAGAVLDGADARLVSSRAFASVQKAASAIANDPRAALRACDTHADALVDALTLLPVTRNEIERYVVTAAEAVHGSTADRLDALRLAVDAEAERVRRLGSDVEQCAMQARALDERLTRHGEALAESEDGRVAAFEAELEAFRAELARAQQEAAGEVAAHVVEIRRMEQECAKLAGTMGLEGTAEFYRRHGRRQQLAAEMLRGLAVLAVLGAVAIALAGTVVADATAEALVSGLVASLLLAGLAAYLARQSGRHRAREEHASAIQLELAAFGPFIEPLSAERREEERVVMARKLFGASEGPRVHDQDADDRSNGTPGNGARTSTSRSTPAPAARAAAANGAGTNGTAPL